MTLNLYMVRAILIALGQEDYGIYTLVAGIVNLLSFLNSTMSGATSRFLTYDLGQGDIKQVNKTFRVAITLHIGIAIALFLLAETIGLWIINYKLAIPENRLLATNIVYQTSIGCMVARILQVPFNASILSNEKMNVYAWIEICYTLLLVFGINILKFYNGDRLISYGSLLFFSTIISCTAYIMYAKHNFAECNNISPLYEKQLLKPMLTFSGWDLYGNMCASARVQGLSILLNKFFGPLLNAAAGVAGQIQAAVLAFTTAVTSAFRPQIIKCYSIGDFVKLRKLLGLSINLGIFLFTIIAIPIYFELPYILKLWLGTPPIHTDTLARLMLIACFWGVINSILIIPIHSTGRIKTLSFVGGSLHLVVLPLGYILLLIDSNPASTYWANCIGMFSSAIFTFTLLKKMLPQLNLWSLIINEIFPIFFCVTLSLVILIGLRYIGGIEEGLHRLCIIGIVYTTTLAFLVYHIRLSAKEKIAIKSFISNKFLYES